jgi:nicotinamidase-related amidase
VIATAPLDPGRTALLMIASPARPLADAPGAGLLGRAAALLARARATGAHVVHVRHLPAGGAADGPSVAPAGWEWVLDTPEADPFAGTGLAEDLGARGVEAVVVAGPMSLACCGATSSRALERRFRTVVAEDATDAGEHGAVERQLVLRARTRAGAEVLSTEAIAALLDATIS